MTPAVKWAKEHAFAIACVFVALLVAHDVQGCRTRRGLEEQLSAARSGASLRSKGELSPDQVSQGDLEAKEAAVLAASPKLAVERAQAALAAPGAKVVGVLEAETVEAEAHGKPTPTIEPPAAPDVTPNQYRPARLCLLADGDHLKLKAKELTLEVDGARDVKGVMQAWRFDPDGGRELLLEEPLAAQLSLAYERAPAPASGSSAASGWGAGPLAGVGTGGWVAGAVATTPGRAVPLLPCDVAIAGVAVAGPGGWFVAAGPFGRF